MKIIDGKKMYKPDEVATIVGYHPRTVRRLIQLDRIKAVDSNVGGKQPVWWVTESELARIRAQLTGVEKRGRPTKKTKAKKSRKSKA